VTVPKEGIAIGLQVKEFRMRSLALPLRLFPSLSIRYNILPGCF